MVFSFLLHFPIFPFPIFPIFSGSNRFFPVSHFFIFNFFWVVVSAHFFWVVVSAHYGPIPPSPILLWRLKECNSWTSSVTLHLCVRLFRLRTRVDTIPGGYSSEFLVGVCRPVPQILTQFQTKIFHFPHPFSDLDSKIHTHFQTFVVS